MPWELLVNEQDREHMWIREIDGVHLTVYRVSEPRDRWKWIVEYGIATVVGYARTARAAKCAATRVGKRYALQGVLWGF